MPRGRYKKRRGTRRNIYDVKWIKHINGEVQYEYEQNDINASSRKSEESEESKSQEHIEEEENVEDETYSTDSEMFNDSDPEEEEEVKGPAIQDIPISTFVNESEDPTQLPPGAVSINSADDPLPYNYPAPENMSQKMAPKQPTSRPGMVSAKRFRKMVGKTTYLTLYFRTSKFVSLEEAISDLKLIIKSESALKMVDD